LKLLPERLIRSDFSIHWGSQTHFDCVVFDLDGVVTQTSKVHTKAWKATFDEFLAKRCGEHYTPFSNEDYLKYVDGKPRYNGVTDFLKSRDIDLPFGDPSDTTDKLTICGVGNRKNDLLQTVLKRDGVEVYDSTVRLLNELVAAGIKRGVASSSKNCEFVLQSAGLMDLIQTRVDGVVSATLGLKGKPEPDIFVVAAKNLGFSPDRAIVFEDAESGVQAGKRGGFALTVGLAREHNEAELKASGADVVFPDWGDHTIADLDRWCAEKKAGTL